MARKKISARASAGTLTGEEIIPVVRLNVADPNLVTTAQAIADLAGGNSIISNTVEDMQTLANSGDFDPGAFYLVTDAGVSDIGFLCQAISASALSPSGSAGFYVPDFQAAGDYSGVSGFGQQRGVWIGANEGDYSAGDVVIWNGRHYKYVGGGDGVTTPETGNYELLAKSLTNGYIIEWDAVNYDLGNNWIFERKDKRGNIIHLSSLGFADIGSDAISGFQWGNDNVFENRVWAGNLTCLNNSGSIFENECSDEAGINAMYNYGTIRENRVLNESYMDANYNTGTIRSSNIEGPSGVEFENNSGTVNGVRTIGQSNIYANNNAGELIGITVFPSAQINAALNIGHHAYYCTYFSDTTLDPDTDYDNIIDAIQSGPLVSAQSGDFSANGTNGTKYTNTGAVGFITATLGDSEIDTEYTFCPDPDNGFNIGILTAAGLQAVVGNVGTFTDSILGFVASGGSVTFTKITATTWLCTSAIGTIALD